MTKNMDSRQHSILMEKLEIFQGYNININNNTFHLYGTFILLIGFYVHYHIYIGHRSNSIHAS